MNKDKSRVSIPAPHKTVEHLKHEWDRIAPFRHQQLSGNRDLSYRDVLLPAICELLEARNLHDVVDLGCGTGELTKELALRCGHVVGVDLSLANIAIARQECTGIQNVSLWASSVERFSDDWSGSLFSVAVANMVLMDCLDLDSFLNAAGHLLVGDGHFIATITHPCYWPRYWGYESADWYSYGNELVIESPFRISAEQSSFITTHVHRPLSQYIESLSKSGFHVDRMLEPVPDEMTQAKFPKPWAFPRFIAFCARKISK